MAQFISTAPDAEEDQDLDRGIFGAIAFCALHRSQLVARGSWSSKPLVLGASAAEDAALLLTFREAFPLLDVDDLAEADLKEGRAREDWETFLARESTGAEELTMLRCDSSGGYTDENMMLVPRLQFMCVEVAREAEGHGMLASEVALTECMREITGALRTAMSEFTAHELPVGGSAGTDSASKGSRAAVLAQLSSAQQLPMPNRNVLSNSQIGRAVRRASQCDDPKVSAAATQLLRRWKSALLLRDMAHNGESAGAPPESVREAARVALQALDARGGSEGDPAGLDSDSDAAEGTEGDSSGSAEEADGLAAGSGPGAHYTIHSAASWSTGWKPTTALNSTMIEQGSNLLEEHVTSHAIPHPNFVARDISDRL